MGWVEASGDCDDADSDVHPNAEELPEDDLDQNCDGQELCWKDGDGDGYSGTDTTLIDGTDCPSGPTGDCDDSDETSSPIGTEVCDDGIDQDCSGEDLVCEPGDTEAPEDTDSPPSWVSTTASGGCSTVPGAGWLGLWLVAFMRRR